MSTCNSCGGVVGRDCFNPQECEWISHQQAQRAHEGQAYQCGYADGLREGIAQGQGGVRDGWRTIESAPKDGTRILIADELTSTRGYWQDAEGDGVDYMGADGGFVDDDFQAFSPSRTFGSPSHQYVGLQPTHWMPMPMPPAPQHGTED